MSIVPQSVLVDVGQRMEMECRTTENGAKVREWTVRRIGKTEEEKIWSNWDADPNRISPSFTHFKVDLSADGTALISSNSIRFEDAGIYSCSIQTENRQPIKYNATLTVVKQEKETTRSSWTDPIQVPTRNDTVSYTSNLTFLTTKTSELSASESGKGFLVAGLTVNILAVVAAGVVILYCKIVKASRPQKDLHQLALEHAETLSGHSSSPKAVEECHEYSSMRFYSGDNDSNLADTMQRTSTPLPTEEEDLREEDDSEGEAGDPSLEQNLPGSRYCCLVSAEINFVDVAKQTENTNIPVASGGCDEEESLSAIYEEVTPRVCNFPVQRLHEERDNLNQLSAESNDYSDVDNDYLHFHEDTVLPQQTNSDIPSMYLHVT